MDKDISDVRKSIEKHVENEKKLESYHGGLNITDSRDLVYKIKEDAKSKGDIKEHIAGVNYIYEHDDDFDFETTYKDYKHIGVRRTVNRYCDGYLDGKIPNFREERLSFMTLDDIIKQISDLRSIVRRIKMKLFNQMVENDAVKKREEDG